MMSVACKDMGQDCDFVATGATAEEVGAALSEHGMAAHGMTEADMNSPENMAKMEAAMKNDE
jgi:predicted small metal-binding protein